MIKKRIYLISAIAVLFVALTCVYFIVIAPMLKDLTTNEPIKLLEGEAYASSTTVLMFEHQPREAIQSIEVNNKAGSYKFFYDEKQKDFFIEGYLNAPYSKEMFSTLISNAGFPATMRRVTEKADDFSKYGLAESDNPSYYVLTTRKGVQHKVYIGNLIPTGAGFYARYEGRDAVYIVDGGVSQTLLGPVENLITPMLFIPTSQTDYFTVKDFILLKYDDNKTNTDNGDELGNIYENLDTKNVFVAITSKTKEEQTENGEKYEDFLNYQMYYPGIYNVSTSYDELLQSFMDFYGEAVIKLGKDDEVFTKEDLKEFNLDKPAYEIFFTHKGIHNNILISKQNEDGSYYAYSPLFNTVILMAEEKFDFLEWELIEYVEKPIFQYNIKDISSISISSGSFEETFILYTSEGETTTNPITGVTSTETILEVKLKSTDKYIDSPDNFRQLYMMLLTTNLVTTADVEDETGLDCLATFKIITKEGKKLEYAFYPYSTRRCFFTLNGKGEFYVLKDSIENIVNAAQKVIKGETVDYQNPNG
ncbi:MAG: DUF4340 domain-containing protein [Ruminococcaceae bacterium]|nr:DUF4340 domain-containing protein [Oscillospiraceae bacterium]